MEYKTSPYNGNFNDLQLISYMTMREITFNWFSENNQALVNKRIKAESNTCKRSAYTH